MISVACPVAEPPAYREGDDHSKSGHMAIPFVRDRKEVASPLAGGKKQTETPERDASDPAAEDPVTAAGRWSATADPISCPMRRRQNAPLHTVRTPRRVNPEDAMDGPWSRPTLAGLPTFWPMTFHLLDSYSLMAASKAALCAHPLASSARGTTHPVWQTSSSAKSA